MNLDQLNISLEQKNWFFQENFIQDELCQTILNKYFSSLNQNLFDEAKIGKEKKVKNTTIRKSSIKWIDNWNDDESLISLNSIFSQIQESTSQYFRISLKRFESQFAIYNRGGFYKVHLDQLKSTRHRQLTCCLYLNNCAEGGELVLYKKGSKTEVEASIKPLKGSLVIFFSADIYHEVKPVCDSRHSITTWFRDDEILPFI